MIDTDLCAVAFHAPRALGGAYSCGDHLRVLPATDRALNRVRCEPCYKATSQFFPEPRSLSGRSGPPGECKALPLTGFATCCKCCLTAGAENASMLTPVEYWQIVVSLFSFKLRAIHGRRSGRRLPMVGRCGPHAIPCGHSFKEYMTARQCSQLKRKSTASGILASWLCAMTCATTIWSAPIAASRTWMTQENLGHWS